MDRKYHSIRQIWNIFIYTLQVWRGAASFQSFSCSRDLFKNITLILISISESRWSLFVTHY
jgi:hypothetical protein